MSAAGLVSDADLSLGSRIFGSDQTAAAQAIVDRGGDIDWDVAISVRGLTLPPGGRVRIVAPPGCGAILRDGSNVPLWRNDNRCKGVGGSNTSLATLGNIADRDITFEGGTWNGNGPAQSQYTLAGGFNVGFQLWGVEDVVLRDVTVLATACYGLHFANWNRVTISNLRVDQTTMLVAGCDGLHMNGPGRGLALLGMTAKTGDDALALNGDDGILTAPAGITFPFPGDIADVDVTGLYLEPGGKLGVRLLSATARVDRVRIRGVHGVTDSLWAIVDNFLTAEGATQTGTTGPGNFGAIAFEGVDVRIPTVQGWHYEYGKAACVIEAAVETLRLGRVTCRDPLPGHPTVYISGRSGGTVRDLILDGYDHAGAVPPIVCAGPVDRLTVSNPLLRDASSLVQLVPGGHVRRIQVVGGLSDPTANPVDSQGGGYDELQVVGAASPAPAPTGLAARLQGYWRLRDAGPGPLLDSSGHGRHLSGGCDLGGIGLGPFNYRQGGLFGSPPASTRLFGVDRQYLTRPDGSDFAAPAGGFSLWAWVNFASLNQFALIVGKNDGITEDDRLGYLLFANPDGSGFCFSTCGTGRYDGSFAAVHTNAPIAPARWYLVCAYWVSGSAGISADGGPFTVAPAADVLFDAPTNVFRVGADMNRGSLYLDGRVQGLGWATGQITPAELASVWAGGAGGDVA